MDCGYFFGVAEGAVTAKGRQYLTLLLTGKRHSKKQPVGIAVSLERHKMPL